MRASKNCSQNIQKLFIYRVLWKTTEQQGVLIFHTFVLWVYPKKTFHWVWFICVYPWDAVRIKCWHVATQTSELGRKWLSFWEHKFREEKLQLFQKCFWKRNHGTALKHDKVLQQVKNLTSIIFEKCHFFILPLGLLVMSFHGSFEIFN